MLLTNYSFGMELDEDVLARNDFDYKKWTNPLEIRYTEMVFAYHRTYWSRSKGFRTPQQ